MTAFLEIRHSDYFWLRQTMKQKSHLSDHTLAHRLQLREEERQLIEVIRDNAIEDGFRLRLKRKSGIWEVRIKVPTNAGKKHGSARGVGRSFAAAWDDMNPRSS